jgi:hypothetical protein
MQVKIQGIVERRKTAPENSTWWEKLSLAQKFSASSLSQFGYELIFIRHEEGKNLAFLQCDNGIAIIKEDGEINTSPHIAIRSSTN